MDHLTSHKGHASETFSGYHRFRAGMVTPTGGITTPFPASFAERSECLATAPLYTLAVHARVDHVAI